MAEYTEIIFCAEISGNSPKIVIDTISRLGPKEFEAPIDPSFPSSKSEIDSFFKNHSVDFPNQKLLFSFEKQEYFFGTQNYSLSFRTAIPSRRIDEKLIPFLDWIRPYIESGSGSGIICITIEENSTHSVKWYL